jgi:catechol 2,3-dioxygenase-like lactoylglutathione lyase family enzyme
MRKILMVVALFLVSTWLSPGAEISSLRPAISGLAFVRIRVADLEKANSFYSGTVGLPLLSCPGQDQKCFFVSPGQEVDLIKSELVPSENLIALIGIYTSDASALRKYLLSKGQKPELMITDSNGIIHFRIKDPENHAIEFVQAHGVAGSVKSPMLRDSKMIHAGFVVKDRAAMDAFYKDILGFHLYWQGGMKDGEKSWVSMQMPDSADWIEYMLNIPQDADKHLLGVMNHIAIGVPDVKVAGKEIEARGIKLTEQPKLGRDGKWQLNMYDPDDTRVELMDFAPTEKPCCSEFTGTHPKP